MLRLSVLLNKVWGHKGCLFKGQTMRKNRCVRFGFSAGFVLLPSEFNYFIAIVAKLLNSEIINIS